MGRLTAESRKALPQNEFAGPGRSYPIPDASHAVAAKAMASRFASPAVKAKVDAKADRMLGEDDPDESPMKKMVRKGLK